jgi:RHS repeat-associated protein
MLDENGIPVWRAKFSVWGELLDKEVSNDPDYGRQNCNLRFQGQQYDAESGLHYNRYRYYDPDSAQYLSPDPIGLAGGLTPQAYVHDPNGWVDPLGLSTDCPKTTEGGNLPKSPTGPGSVQKSERDPKRLFTPSEREAKRLEQGHECANGCGTKIDGSNSAGHHIKRHADGGLTVPENHAEVCIDCHKYIHSGSN